MFIECLISNSVFADLIPNPPLVRSLSMTESRSLNRRHSPRGAFLSMLILLTGCSTTKQVHLPGELVVPDEGQREVLMVQVGETVRVFLKSGNEARGEVLEMDLERVVLGKPGNYGYREETYYAIEIDRIEAGRSTGVGRFGGGIMVGATLAFILLAIAVGASGGLSVGGS